MYTPIPNRLCLDATELRRAANAQRLSPDVRKHLRECALCRDAVDAAWLHERGATDSPTRARAPRTTPHVPLYQRAGFRVAQWTAVAAALACLVYAGLRYSSNDYYDPALSDTFAYVEEPYARVFRSAEPDDGRDIYFEAARAFEQGDFDRSLSLYDSALVEAETEMLVSRGHYERGVVLWRAGRVNEAISELTTARLGAYEFYEDATWSLARIYEQLGQPELAVELYRDLLFLNGGPYMRRAAGALERLGESPEDL